MIRLTNAGCHANDFSMWNYFVERKVAPTTPNKPNKMEPPAGACVLSARSTGKVMLWGDLARPSAEISPWRARNVETWKLGTRAIRYYFWKGSRRFEAEHAWIYIPILRSASGICIFNCCFPKTVCPHTMGFSRCPSATAAFRLRRLARGSACDDGDPRRVLGRLPDARALFETERGFIHGKRRKSDGSGGLKCDFARNGVRFRTSSCFFESLVENARFGDPAREKRALEPSIFANVSQNLLVLEVRIFSFRVSQKTFVLHFGECLAECACFGALDLRSWWESCRKCNFGPASLIVLQRRFKNVTEAIVSRMLPQSPLPPSTLQEGYRSPRFRNVTPVSASRMWARSPLQECYHSHRFSQRRFMKNVTEVAASQMSPQSPLQDCYRSCHFRSVTAITASRTLPQSPL